jgi:hypothetical protein
LIAILLGGCQKSDGGRTSAAVNNEAEEGPAFTSVALHGTNSYGGFFDNGLLVFNYDFGAVTACFKKCVPIGTTEPAKHGQIDIKVGEAADAYLVNNVNGHVFKCHIETDDFADNFKGGACTPLGAAAPRPTPAARGEVSPEKPPQSSEANVGGSSSSSSADQPN